MNKHELARELVKLAKELTSESRPRKAGRDLDWSTNAGHVDPTDRRRLKITIYQGSDSITASPSDWNDAIYAAERQIDDVGSGW